MTSELEACQEYERTVRAEIAEQEKPRFALPLKLTNYGKTLLDAYGDVICKCETQYAAQQIKELIESENQ
jgi:hypothetical protein